VQFGLFLLLLSAFIQTLIILKHWVYGATSATQYKLEKKSYLISTIILVSLFINITLLLFFAYTLNELSSIIPGAMCGAGVISSNIFGEPMMILKFFIILFSMIWIAINKRDNYSKDYKYFKMKLFLFVILFITITSDLFLTLAFINNLNTDVPVLCCSNIYAEINHLPFSLKEGTLVILFYILYIFIMLFAYLKKRKSLLLLNLLYAVVSYFTLTYFFSTYIYELPTHKCPYCLLQSDYYYIGYFIYGAFMVSLFYSLMASIFDFTKDLFYKTMLWHTIFIFLISYKFILYFFFNGTLLRPF
jgi:hypothetical protein